MSEVPVSGVLILGPTASGKSAAAMHVAQALHSEIISVDSAQIYRGMDIGTAKPSPAERHAVAHHLIDILDPVQSYSAARFAQDAQRLIDAIGARAMPQSGKIFRRPEVTTHTTIGLSNGENTNLDQGTFVVSN
ncbi:MAG: tRNA (adenosine(37)-N6)-dimethylallyltransferase, partial [Quisquiliibacterium sp.]